MDNNLQQSSLKPIVEDTSISEGPETNVVVNESTAGSSTVVAGRNKATGGATIVEGESPSGGVSTFGEHTMQLIAQEAADAALNSSVGVNLDIANAQNVQQGKQSQISMMGMQQEAPAQMTQMNGQLGAPAQMTQMNGQPGAPAQMTQMNGQLGAPAQMTQMNGQQNSTEQMMVIGETTEVPAQKISKGMLVFSIILGIAAAVGSFIGVTYLFQR